MYLEKIRRLPDGTKSRVIQAAHKIAEQKRHDHVGPGAINAGETILYYDEDTWTQAWMEVNPYREEVNELLMGITNPDSRYRWCTSTCCACMGCANSSGVTEEEHIRWVKENPRQPQDDPDNPIYWDDYDPPEGGMNYFEKQLAKIIGGSTDRVNLIRILRRRRGRGLKDACEQLDKFLEEDA